MPTPTLAQVMARSTARTMRNLGVATVGIVQSFDADACTCTVQPGIHKLIPTPSNELADTVEEYPALQNVPVVMLRFRGMFVDPQAGALLPGDPVLLVCLDRDPANWRRTGKASEPMDARLHDWAHCVAIPGLVPNTNPFEPTLVLNKDAVALASKLDQLIGILRTVTETGTGLIKAAVDTAFPLVPAGVGTPNLTLTTTGSKVLKVQE